MNLGGGSTLQLAPSMQGWHSHSNLSWCESFRNSDPVLQSAVFHSGLARSALVVCPLPRSHFSNRVHPGTGRVAGQNPGFPCHHISKAKYRRIWRRFGVSPAAQLSHRVGSLSSELRYRPASHFLHASPFTLLYCPAPHDVHLALPSESDDWPATQSVHAVELEDALTLPLGHL